MVKNNSGGNKSKNIGSKFAKKTLIAPDPDFENSFFGIMTSKPNGLIAKVKIIPHKNEQLKYLNDQEIQVNIGKMKHDKRNNNLAVGDVVQIEINFEMKRQNGSQYAVVLCKYTSTDVRNFKKLGLIPCEVSEKQQDEEEDIFENSLEDL
jgi:hypothetical protein